MDTSKSTKIHYLRTAVLFASMFAAIPVVDSFSTHPTYAADPPPTCQTLTATESDDKNYYNFAVTATAANDDDISGYQFDFGDRESYTFSFDKRSTDSRQQATVRHTYEKAGTYTVIAKVISAKNGQASQISSNNCTVNVTIVEAVAELPSTGPNISTTLLIASIVGILTYTATLKNQRKNLDR